MYKVRSDEPAYAFLWDRETQATNRYGQPIDTAPEGDALRQQPFVINNETQPRQNPNRYKQHGFYFNADNCIGCHACEAACSEKNENPGHIAFRSVGYVESGTHPAYRRVNISLACNHCDDPVCLKGCPTRAYTKFAEYGAVLQDPEICFGCGYCTWVCPYNAPQLDPVKGQVSKCNMCVDRLEVGLKPACVAACLGSALDFGVVENVPENRDQALTTIPGFPDPEITHPNIRFQQTRSLQRDVTRPDTVPVKYHRDDDAKKYRPVVDKKLGDKREWNWKKLLTSHENAHAMFTLAAQTVMGAFMILLFGPILGLEGVAQLKQSSAFVPLLGVMLALLGFGLFKLNMHLGKPHRFYRGYNNLRLSPVSREIAGVSAFFAGLAGYSFFSLFDNGLANLLGSLFALLGVAGFGAGSWYMYKLYRIPARPYWNHWHTAAAFYGTMLSLGGLLIAILAALFMDSPQTLIKTLAGVAAVGLVLESIGLIAHERYLRAAEGEAQAAWYLQNTQFGKTYWLRNALMAFNIVALVAIAWTGLSGVGGALAGVALALSMLLAAYIGRILFYALVIPTTMPGHFFWKNPGFIEHARQFGLADRGNTGVVSERHHKFDLAELMKTVRENSIGDMLTHVRRILRGK